MIQDFLFKIIESNTSFDIGNYLIIYIISIWILFCIWVFVDASKRYKNWIIAVIMFFITLFFNFPGLLFYLIIRPEKEEDHILFIGDNNLSYNQGGINVPIVNFKGDDGFEISLKISVKNKKGKIENDSLPKVSFDVEVDDTKQFEVVESAIKQQSEQKVKNQNLLHKIFDKRQIDLASKLNKIIKFIQDKVKSFKKTELNDFSSVDEVGNDDDRTNEENLNDKNNKEQIDSKVEEGQNDIQGELKSHNLGDDNEGTEKSDKE